MATGLCMLSDNMTSSKQVVYLVLQNRVFSEQTQRATIEVLTPIAQFACA